MGRIHREKPMKEILYRESRVAKALGEPSKYAIVQLLLKHAPLNVSEIVKNLKRSQSTISHHLAALRSLEIVRFETKADGVYYWIKYPQELRTILNALEVFIKRTQRGIEHEE
jgi:DNA-binding transcriptional ArsR family regulator